MRVQNNTCRIHTCGTSGRERGRVQKTQTRPYTDIVDIYVDPHELLSVYFAGTGDGGIARMRCFTLLGVELQSADRCR